MPTTPIGVPLMYLVLHRRRDGRKEAALDSDGSRYASVTTPTLLLGGGRSPGYLRDVLPIRAAIMPQAKVEIISELDHNGPDIGGPEKVAALIRA